jgi:hypothetical protein
MNYLLVWVSIAAACAVYADHRGRNAPVWFLVGLALSLFALFMLWLLEPFDNAKSCATARRLGVSNYHRRCPGCGVVVPIRCVACGQCHVRLPPLLH